MGIEALTSQLCSVFDTTPRSVINESIFLDFELPVSTDVVLGYEYSCVADCTSNPVLVD